MKKIICPIFALVITGCAANPSVHSSTSQNYRAKGEENQLKVNAAVVHKKNLLEDDYAAIFQIDDKNALGFQLDKSGNGSLSCAQKIDGDKGLYFCYPHNGKKIGANCTGSTANNTLVSVYCTFQYDNEIAANFTIK